MTSSIRAWHFVGGTLRDGRPVPADGEWLLLSGPVEMCKWGLHASLHPLDALQYAPGNTLCLVECADIVQQDPDKFVCRRRRIIARADATEALQYFARMQAASVVHLWDAPDVVLDYLMTGSRAAAAKAAAWDAVRAAAGDVARAAVRAAAWAAAWDVARDAARAAVWAAAGDAEIRDEFLALVTEAFGDYL